MEKKLLLNEIKCSYTISVKLMEKIMKANFFEVYTHICTSKINNTTEKTLTISYILFTKQL